MVTVETEIIENDKMIIINTDYHYNNVIPNKKGFYKIPEDDLIPKNMWGLYTDNNFCSTSSITLKYGTSKPNTEKSADE